MWEHSWPRDTCVVWHSPRALCNKSFWLGVLRNMCTVKGKKTWKMIWFIHISALCCCTDKQTQIETQRIFQFQFSSLYSFQCNNQRNIKAGSEYPTPTKFVLQRHKFLLPCNQTKYFPLSTANVLYYTYTLWFRLNPNGKSL